MDREQRWMSAQQWLEARADDEGKLKGIRGTAAVFGSPAIIGWFEERIEVGAFDHVLDDDVVGLFNHNRDLVLGRTPLTMSLSVDERALRFDIPDLPGARADVLEAVRRGDVRGNSFSFDMEGGDFEFVDRTSEGKIPLRVIKRIGRLYDVGPVTEPAYVDTKVSLRSMQEAAELSPNDRYRERIQQAIESRQFTCPKPFDTLEECTASVEGEVEDPEAFCAAWENECEGNSKRHSCGCSSDKDARIADLEARLVTVESDLRVARMFARPHRELARTKYPH